MAVTYFMAGTLLSRVKLTGIAFKISLFIIAIFAIIYGVIFLMPIGMGDISFSQIPLYLIASTIISFALITLCFSVASSKSLIWLIKLGQRSMDILIFHFLMFKIISLIKIWHYGLPIERLADFPVINDANKIYWIAYVVVGVGGSLLLADGVAIVRRRFFNLFSRFSIINK